MTNCNRAFLIFVLALSISLSTAVWYNESALEEIYKEGTQIYNNAKHHWSMSDGYDQMLGVSGMKVCFVEGPEVEALILGGDMNTTNVTLELEDSTQRPISVAKVDYTVAFWYSFRPVDFLTHLNTSMACHLLKIGDHISVSYEGGDHEYNLNYKFWKYEIEDTEDRPHMEFLVNDTNGAAVNRSWQWNHVAMVYTEKSLMVYYNGYNIANSTTSEYDSFTVPNHLYLNKELDGKTCSMLGIDEVTLWEEALSKDDLLAVRLHVGRNRSLDEEETTTAAETTTPLDTTTEPPTTEPPTSTEELTTTEEISTTLKATTNMMTTAPKTTSAAESTAGTTVKSTAVTSEGSTSSVETTVVTSDATTPQTTVAQTTTGVRTTTAVGETMADTTTSQPGSTMPESTMPDTTSKMTTQKTRTEPSVGATTEKGTTKPTEALSTTEPMTTLSVKEQELDDLSKNVTNTTDPVKIVEIINNVEAIVEKATSEETVQIAGAVVSLMETLAKYTPVEKNSTNETKTERQNYRKAYVSCFSTVLVKADEDESLDFDADKLVEIMDSFLGSYVDDDTIVEDESLESEAVDIKLMTVGRDLVESVGNTTVEIPSGAFGAEASNFKVLVCVLSKGLQNRLEPKGGEQPVSLTGNYSNATTWNISGPIIVMRVSGSLGSDGSYQLQGLVSFKVPVDPSLGQNPVCVYQDKLGKWSGKGLNRIKFDIVNKCVTCTTSHMTNFAVLMAVDGGADGVHAQILSVISCIGCGLSLVCLLIAIILFIILRELNSTRMGIIKNLCVALFLAQLLFVSGVETAKVNETACKFVAAMLHYFFLSVMAWMLCNGIYLYLKVKKAARPGSVVDLIYFCFLGWGLPAVVVAITAGINHKVYGSKDLCWLSVDESGVWAFVIPAMAIILFNAFVMFLTMKTFVSVKVFKDKNDKDKFKSGLRAMVVMLPILGLSWVFGLLAFDSSHLSLMFNYLFAVFNSLQGVFLFIFHILLNEEVKGAMRRRFGKVGASGEENMLFNKIWAFSSSGNEKTEMSSVTQHEKKRQAPVYKN